MVLQQHIKWFCFILCFLVFCSQSHAQKDHIESLSEKVKNNRELFRSDPNQAFQNTEILLEQAVALKDNKSELSLLEHRCWYYNYRVDIDNLINEADYLRKKAVEYKEPAREAGAHTYLMNAYAMSDLYDKAVSEFEQTMVILEQMDAHDSQVINSKMNAYIYRANMYIRKNNYGNALDNLILAGKEVKKIQDPELKRKMQYRNYSHIALVYTRFNLDSAEYYINKSIDLNAQKEHDILFLNYSLLGDIYIKRKKYESALFYYGKAETMPEEIKDPENLKSLYEGFINIYEAIGNKQKTEEYKQKLKAVQLELAENRSRALYNMVKNNDQKKPEENNTDKKMVLIISLSFLGAVLFLAFLYKNHRRIRKKNLPEKEGNGEEPGIPNEQLNSEPTVHFKELSEMVKENDPVFMAAFNKAFPCFKENLIQINPALTSSEIEFCAFLKLNLSTKEISHFTFTSQRTVQNKKYRIRKKLNIPENIDIYNWLSNF